MTDVAGILARYGITIDCEADREYLLDLVRRLSEPWLLFQWFRNRIVLAQSTPESVVDGSFPKPHAFSPLSFVESDAIYGNEDIGSFIVVLLCARRPPAVVRGVWPIDVNPINRKPCLALTHVSKKIFKNRPPATDCNAPSAIVAEVVCGRVEAPLSHTRPYPVSQSTRETVGSMVCANHFEFKAPTRLGLPVAQPFTLNYSGFSAIANTIPARLSAAVICGARHDSEATKRLPSKVFEVVVWHFRHLRKFIIERVRQALMKTLFGSYPSRTSWSLA